MQRLRMPARSSLSLLRLWLLACIAGREAAAQHRTYNMQKVSGPGALSARERAVRRRRHPPIPTCQCATCSHVVAARQVVPEKPLHERHPFHYKPWDPPATESPAHISAAFGGGGALDHEKITARVGGTKEMMQPCLNPFTRRLCNRAPSQEAVGPPSSG